uniref:Uncharacterized protein MANES_08G036100 n=1 Tax=Rhizophora mucronata TaxID=61149 RepID=A0A2P2JUD2_RHIMU
MLTLVHCSHGNLLCLCLMSIQMQEKLKHWSKSFANAFQSQKFQEARTCIRRMTYYDRVNEEIVKRL